MKALADSETKGRKKVVTLALYKADWREILRPSFVKFVVLKHDFVTD